MASLQISLLVCVFVCGSIMGNPVSTFPEISHLRELLVRLKSVKNENYLFMRVDEQGVSFGTKAVTSEDDPEVEFSLHLYSVAELNKTVLVLPVHPSSHRFLQMSTRKDLEVSPIQNNLPEISNSLRKADSRFFYMRRAIDQAMDACVFEAMNGADSGYFLAVNGTKLTLKEYNGNSDSYPADITFNLDTFISNNIA